MKNMLYTGFFSALLSSCAAPQTTFVDHPVVIDSEKAVYTNDSDGNCYLRVPREDGKNWKLYDEQCDETVDSVALSFQERFLFQHDRKDLDIKNRHFFDSLFQKAVQYRDNKLQRCDYNGLF